MISLLNMENCHQYQPKTALPGQEFLKPQNIFDTQSLLQISNTWSDAVGNPGQAGDISILDSDDDQIADGVDQDVIVFRQHV